MIRTSSHRLGWNTGKKESSIGSLFFEYGRVVQYYIDALWKEERVSGSFVKPEILNGIESWLSARLRQCAGKQAIQIVKSTQKKNKDLIYRQYKRVFAKAKARNKDWEITKIRFSEWIKGRIYKKVSKPEFSGDSIELDRRFISIEDGRNTFDLWFRLSSIGNKLIFTLPSKKHNHYNSLAERNFHLRKSCRLKRLKNSYYIDLFHEKETPELKKTGETLGIDVGINKLIATSDNQMLGTNIKSIINKLNKRLRGSHNYNQTTLELRNYINRTVNQIEWGKYNTCAVEDITNITKDTKKKNKNKSFRKILSHWNQRFLLNKIRMACEDNRVNFTSINPAFTSQTCSVCGHSDPDSRNGELFKCTLCGASIDADYNAAMNIKSRALNRPPIVACETKIQTFHHFS